MHETMKYYTGIGAIDTPSNVLDLMVSIGRYFAKRNYTLRSGGAKGADQAFEKGCGNGPKEIYLPFENYENNPSPLFMTEDLFQRVSRLEIWRKLCVSLATEEPSIDLDSLPKEMQYHFARDVQQILGADFNTPSDKVICWTPDNTKEGTRITLYIATHLGIPIDNLSSPQIYSQWENILASNF